MRSFYVAVPPGRAPADPGTGAGRVWASVTRVLREHVRLREVDPDRRRPARRPDVWLIPGHEGPVERSEPVVAVVHGSAWTTSPAGCEPARAPLTAGGLPHALAIAGAPREASHPHCWRGS